MGTGRGQTGLTGDHTVSGDGQGPDCLTGDHTVSGDGQGPDWFHWGPHSKCGRAGGWFVLVGPIGRYFKLYSSVPKE